MKNIINKDLTKKLSDLIKIKLSTTEESQITDSLNTVLDSVTVLEELNTENVGEAYRSTDLENVLREDDHVAEPLDMSKYKNTKNFKNGYFISAKVIKK